jgi:hypothetical protein
LIAAGVSLALVWAQAPALPMAEAAPASSAQTMPGQGAPPQLELAAPPAATPEAAPRPALELAPAPALAPPLATEPSGTHVLERWWFWTAVVAVGLTAFLAIAATSLSTPGAPSTELGNRVAF